MFLISSLHIVIDMRTKTQHQANLKGIIMMTEIKSALVHAKGTLLQDAAGLMSLVAMLVIGLNLPDLI